MSAADVRNGWEADIALALVRPQNLRAATTEGAMHKSMFTILFAALIGCSTLPQSVPLESTLPAAIQADSDAIRALEQQWGQAFLQRDSAALERIVAPEFRLMRAQNGTVLFTPRDRWFANARRMTFQEYEVQVTDVLVSGDTAVATVEGRWKIGSADRRTREEGFILSDTWVRRDGRWQVVYRHSTPFGTRDLQP